MDFQPKTKSYIPPHLQYRKIFESVLNFIFSDLFQFSTDLSQFSEIIIIFKIGKFPNL